MSAPQILAIFDVALLAMAGLMVYDGRMTPAWSLLGALAVLMVWQAVLATLVRQPAKVLRIESFFRKTHYVQAILHTSMYTYLGLYWPDVKRFAPLIVAQILLGYLLDMLLSWSRRRVWRFGFGVVPIVLSTNLFLWFKDEHFYLQVLLIVVTFFGKEFITWNYDGRRRHIFNPSAFSLSVASLLMMATGTVSLCRGQDIAAAFELPPNFYEVIFLLGVVVQLFFVVTPVSFGTAAALVIWHRAWPIFLGGDQLSATPIHPAVFLGMTFLVTDPATSPKTSFGRFLFGLAYGTGVMITFVLLRKIEQPAFFDKLLVVPVVNLLLPLFDRISNWPTTAATPANDRVTRFGWLAAYVAFFILVLPSMKGPRNVRSKFLPRPAGTIAPDLDRMIHNMAILRGANPTGQPLFPDAYRPFGFAGEMAHYPEIRAAYLFGTGPGR